MYVIICVYIYIHMIHLFNMAHWSSMKIGYPTINLMGNMMINLIKLSMEFWPYTPVLDKTRSR